jgi:isopentenyl phosphate kinase
MHLRLIKLGGSVVTHKAAEPFFVDNVDRLANELAPHSCGVILVHGTGHIGKPYAVKHEFLRDGIIPATKPLLAVEIKSVLRRLNVDIVDSMRRAKIPAYSVEPSDYFMDDYSGFRSPMWQQKLVTQMSLGFMPVFYGDVMSLADGSYKVFSSDVMMEILSRSLQPAQTLFVRR